MMQKNNKLPNISNQLQCYIEVIYDLCLEHQHAHIKSIAEKMNVKMSSVTEAVSNLAAAELVNYNPRKPITLTDSGLQIAEQLLSRHKILADFFSIIGCTTSLAEETACNVEHIIDDTITEKISMHIKLFNSMQKN